MMPRTLNNLNAMEVLSAMQKHIRRGEERQAMLCACELGHTSKAFFSMMVNRLEIIAHEDVGLANPQGVMFTATAVEQARRLYDPDAPGKWRLAIGNAILMLCRGPKSREGDHFQAAVGQGALQSGTTPELPDYVFDGHTHRGKRLGRGLEYFRTESTKLVPRPKKDAYEDEAYEVWQRKQEAKRGKQLF